MLDSSFPTSQNFIPTIPIAGLCSTIRELGSSIYIKILCPKLGKPLDPDHIHIVLDEAAASVANLSSSNSNFSSRITDSRLARRPICRRTAYRSRWYEHWWKLEKLNDEGATGWGRGSTGAVVREPALSTESFFHRRWWIRAIVLWIPPERADVSERGSGLLGWEQYVLWIGAVCGLAPGMRNADWGPEESVQSMK